MRGNSERKSAAAAASTTVDMLPLCVRADVSSVNENDRTVELVFSTGAGVERYDYRLGRYIEKLSLKKGDVRLGRLNSGAAPVLDTHSAWSISDQIGVVEPNSIKFVDGEGRATVRFSKRETVEPIWQDVKDRIIRNVSIGYIVHRFLEDKGDDAKIPTRTAVDWEPYEISMVPMPADAGAQVRNEDKAKTNRCVILRTITNEDADRMRRL